MRTVEVIIGGTVYPSITPSHKFVGALGVGLDVVVTVSDIVVLASPAGGKRAYVDVFIGCGATQTRWMILEPARQPRDYTVSHRFASVTLRRVSRQGRIPPRLANLMVWRPL